MKPYNLVIEFDVSSEPGAPSSPLLCMLSFSFPDDADMPAAMSLFRNEFIDVIAFARTAKTYMPVSTAVLKAAKKVQDTFHCECFMLEANGKMCFELFQE